MGFLLAAVLLIALLAASARIVQEYERGVIFRIGRIVGAKGPGLFLIIPVLDRMVKVNLQTITMDVPPQECITRDNVTVRVNAVTYFHVMDPVKAVVAIQNFMYGTSQVVQTTLRSIIGQSALDDLLINRDDVNVRLQQVIDQLTDPWGVKVTLVEVKDVELPEGMRRAMARQAEAERERRAKVIHAMGELEAAETLGRAALEFEKHPAAMQLRTLSTMAEVSTEKNSTLIFPLPMEFIHLAHAVTRQLSGDRPPKGPPKD
ncbi:MAG TPA: slipin family protein [Actinomycetota bacterium]|nr:slipin family protein [Actinomycetota bacterium]